MTHWLGTDGQGRDMLSAMLYGLRISLLVGLASGAIALVVGTVVGLIAAFRGGWVDAILMRIVDLQLSFPTILVALILLVLLGEGVDKIIFALVVVQWAYFARTVRGVALVEGSRDYVDAARGLKLPPLAHPAAPHPAQLPAHACSSSRRSRWRRRSRSKPRSPSSGSACRPRGPRSGS